jgi:hypothetical protein
VTPDKERRYVGGAFITLNGQMRERLWARVRKAKGKPVEGVGDSCAASPVRNAACSCRRSAADAAD